MCKKIPILLLTNIILLSESTLFTVRICLENIVKQREQWPSGTEQWYSTVFEHNHVQFANLAELYNSIIYYNIVNIQ